jgi:hypothetical protein
MCVRDSWLEEQETPGFLGQQYPSLQIAIGHHAIEFSSRNCPNFVLLPHRLSEFLNIPPPSLSILFHQDVRMLF